jgi:hypothetical protein
MKNLINYWKLSSSAGRFNLISYFLLFPFFVIHELSHLIVVALSGKFFIIKKFDFFEIKDDRVTVFSLCLEVHGEVDFVVALGSIMPNIIYFTMLIVSCVFTMMNISWFSVLFYIYVLYGMEAGKCSKEDLTVFKKYFRKKKMIA